MKSHPLKVAYDCQVFALQSYGGVARYFVELAKRVATADDFSVEVVAPLHISPLLRDSGLQVRGCYARSWARSGQLLRTVNRVASVPYLRMSSPHVLHETYYGNWAYTPPGSAVVVTVHDMIHERLPHLFPNDMTPLRKQKAVKRADIVLCDSENTRTDLIEILKMPKERTRVIHLGAGLACGSRAYGFASPMEKPYLLYVGDRGLYKNFSLLLDAYASSARLQREFIVVAFGRQPFWDHETAKFRQLGLAEESVIFRTGDDLTLANYYRYAAALVYPSIYEGFGLPPLEAMSFGCPVACSNTSSLPEIVGDAAILFDPRDAEAARDAIERIVFSRDLRDELAARGRLRIGLFTWERCAQKTMETYRELCGR